jgi:hypothetical protein
MGCGNWLSACTQWATFKGEPTRILDQSGLDLLTVFLRKAIGLVFEQI